MPAYQFDSFVLDSEKRLLLRDGIGVPMTPKAFDILLVLVQHSERVVTKEEMLQTVWSDSQFVEESNLTQNIYTLRHLLGEGENGQRFIQTVPRHGYRFVAEVREVSRTGDAVAQEITQPSFHQLTFRLGTVYRARFAANGRTVVYSAAFDGSISDLYSINSGSDDPESRCFGIPDANIHSLSSSGEIAIALHQRLLRGYIKTGTLARTSLDSGAYPRELLEDVQEAEWSPDGASLAVVREVKGRSRLEYPIGTVLYETGGWISYPRFSPEGDLIAFIDHPLQNDDRGSIAVVNINKRARLLTGEWISAQGLAWAANGNEVWFTGTKKGNTRAIHATTLDGRERLIHQVAGALTLQDISVEGHVLLTRHNERTGIIGLAPKEEKERDLSWLDWSLARDLSADGKTLLFTEAGEGGGATYGVYLRKTDGSPAVRLGNGSAMALSPDGKWALTRLPVSPSQMILLPTGAGEPKPLERAPLSYQQWAGWFPDGERIVFTANELNCGTRLFVQNIKGGAPYTITPDVEGIHLSSPNLISPDGQSIAAIGPDRKIYIYGTEGKKAHVVAGSIAGAIPIRWSADGLSLYVYERGDSPTKIYLIELATGKKMLWKALMPPYPAGATELLRILLTPDGKSYAYTYTRDLSDLYIATGLH